MQEIKRSEFIDSFPALAKDPALADEIFKASPKSADGSQAGTHILSISVDFQASPYIITRWKE